MSRPRDHNYFQFLLRDAKFVRSPVREYLSADVMVSVPTQHHEEFLLISSGNSGIESKRDR
jgi:hypothetical protein